MSSKGQLCLISNVPEVWWCQMADVKKQKKEGFVIQHDARVIVKGYLLLSKLPT